MNTIFSKMRFVPIILFLMWRSKEGWASFGLVKPQFLKDIMIGIGLSLMIVFIEGVISPFFSSHHVLKFHWNFFYPAPVPPNIAFLLLLSSCSIAFSEELVTRSYLIPRFEKIMGNSGVAIFITSILFGLMHSYHGFGSVVKSFLSACIWGIVFCKTRRIWPVFLSHSLIDYIVATHLHTFIGLW